MTEPNPNPGRPFVKRVAYALVFAAAGMTAATLGAGDGLPSWAAIVTFLVAAFLVIGLISLVRVGWRRARK